METTILGYIRTTIRFQSFIPSKAKASFRVGDYRPGSCRKLSLGLKVLRIQKTGFVEFGV